MEQATTRPTTKHRGKWFHPLALLRGLSARPKLYVAIAVAVVVLALTPGTYLWCARAVLGWNAGALIFLGFEFVMMTRCKPGEIRQRAEGEDET